MWVYGLLYVRFLACLAVIPGGRSIAGIGLRLAAATCLTVVAAPCTVWDPARQGDPIPLLVGRECFLGLCLGAAVSLVYSLTEMAGRIAFAGGASEAHEPTPGLIPIRTMFMFLALGVFLEIRGDQALVGHVLATTHRFPVGAPHVDEDWLTSLANVLGAVLRASVNVALPLLATSLFANVVMGLVCRTLPAFPFTGVLQLVAVLAALVILFSGCGWLLQGEWRAVLDGLGRWLGGAP
jgi:flagellar biosynthesis protein FliR